MSSSRVLRSATKKNEAAKPANAIPDAVIDLTSGDNTEAPTNELDPKISPPPSLHFVVRDPSDSSYTPWLRVIDVPGLMPQSGRDGSNVKQTKWKAFKLGHKDSQSAILDSLQEICYSSPATPKSTAAVEREASGIANALASTLILASPDAGTAVVVSASGLVLTCAHCFGETDEGWRGATDRGYGGDGRYCWAMFYTGCRVRLECLRWNPKHDLALARIVALDVRGADMINHCDPPDFIPVEKPAPPGGYEMAYLSTFKPYFQKLRPVFRYMPLFEEPMPSAGAGVVCIGQPGPIDLESNKARKTGYGIVHISEGSYRGLAKGQDPLDCSEIGSLMHNAWTYWGHSGAPIVHRKTGCLLGVHSSWDDQTAMRRGVPAVAIKQFLIDNADVEGVADLLQ